MQEAEIIETPENVELRIPLAGMGSRLLAGLVDHLLLVLLYIVLFFGLVLVLSLNPLDWITPTGTTGAWGLAVLIVLFFLIHWGYFILFEFFTNGQTPGKKYLRIRVTQQEGRPVTFVGVLVRNLIRPVDALGFYAVGGICMFFSRRIQRLGDMAAGTIVASEQTFDYSARTDKKKDRICWEEPEISPEALRASELQPREYRLLSNYWARRHQLTPEARERVLRRLLTPILDRLGREPEDWSVHTLERQVESLIAPERDFPRSTEAEDEA